MTFVDERAACYLQSLDKAPLQQLFDKHHLTYPRDKQTFWLHFHAAVLRITSKMYSYYDLMQADLGPEHKSELSLETYTWWGVSVRAQTFFDRSNLTPMPEIAAYRDYSGRTVKLPYYWYGNAITPPTVLDEKSSKRNQT